MRDESGSSDRGAIVVTGSESVRRRGSSNRCVSGAVVREQRRWKRSAVQLAKEGLIVHLRPVSWGVRAEAGSGADRETVCRKGVSVGWGQVQERDLGGEYHLRSMSALP